jgi:NosR/NirI family nitrous oxide reductase transcriptional regulator
MFKKIKKLKILRISIQLLFFILMTYTVSLTFNGLRAIYTAIILNDFNFVFLFPKIIAVIAIIPITILLGRFFCGWMCAFGTIGDMVYLFSRKVIKHRIKINEKVDGLLKYVKYIILIGCIILIWTFNITFFSSFSPWDAFGLLPNIYAAFATFLIGSIVFILVIIGSFFIERFFCRYLCPLGAFFAFTSKLKLLRIRKPTKKCGKCRICTNNCPMGIPLYKSEIVKSGECIVCMNCLRVCPRKNTNLVINDAPLNSILASTMAVATIAGINYGTGLAKNILPLPTAGITDNSGAISSNSNQGITQNKKYMNGTYTGVADGYRPNLNVTVTIKNDKITNIIIGANHEEPGYREEPFVVIPQRIKATQSTDVAVVSGATYSSNGIKAAVADALSKAAISSFLMSNQTSSGNTSNDMETSSSNSSAPVSSSTPSNTNTQTAKYKDGTYTGDAYGFEGNIGVSITVNGNKITSINILSQNESRPRDAFATIPNSIISVQSINVNAVSGATYSSEGIMNAVNNALSKAS